MGLFLMKPPKPFKQNSNDKGNRNGPNFNLKFDTLNSSIKGEDKLDTNHITEEINQPSTQRDFRNDESKYDGKPSEEINETFDEMY